MASIEHPDIYTPGVDLKIYDACVTGGRNAVVEQLRRKISGFSQVDRNVRAMYIGIASGDDVGRALWRRFDDYKREQGINEMIAVYRSTSEQNCKLIENDLVRFYDDHTLNRTGGGGGRNTSQPYKWVYLALRRLG
jgi:hypothetical protein